MLLCRLNISKDVVDENDQTNNFQRCVEEFYNNFCDQSDEQNEINKYCKIVGAYYLMQFRSSMYYEQILHKMDSDLNETYKKMN